MKIRSITFFSNPLIQDDDFTRKLGEFAHTIKNSCQSNGFEVQSLRLSTQPFPKIMEVLTNNNVIDWVIELEKTASLNGFTYLSVGPALISNPESYKLIPEILKQTKNVFTSGMIADQEHGINFFALEACSKVIVQAASIEPNGFGNLRFSALANVKPLGPFFPGSYFDETKPTGFSIAIEAADEVLSVFRKATSFSEARANLLKILQEKASQIESILSKYLQKFHLEFFGFDFSVAPFPEDFCSLGNSLESLGVQSFGDHGSLAAAAFLAETLDRGNWKRIGFNGLMLPLLEDSILAQRSIDGKLKIKDLLLYSAVCGTGLDTIPISGDVEASAIQSLLLDIAALSSRLQKPLTARLMPIPGKKAGDLTDFDFEFFKNGRILDIEASPLSNLLAYSNENLTINPRK
ncbi:MAG: DUF711 family protein [Anaerolineaceae bacterium]